MYAKLFSSIYQGTLRGNTNGLVVFTNMLAHADSAGWVDIHPRAIAEETGLSIEKVKSAILELSSPDPESRSPEEEGRRIVLIDAHRDWGWRIVNHGKYRAIKSEEDRREQNRLAQQRFREKHSVITSKQPSAQSAQAEAEAEAEALNTSGTNVPDSPRPVGQRPATSRQLICPHQKILSLWAEVLPELPRHIEWNETRAGHLQSRWREKLAEKKWKTEEDGIEFFRKLFVFIGKSRFLTGKSSAKDRPFLIELEWLIRPNNWAKVIEGKYHTEA